MEYRKRTRKNDNKNWRKKYVFLRLINLKIRNTISFICWDIPFNNWK